MKHILLLTALLSSGVFASEFDDTLVLAEQGDANAQYELATMLYQGSDSIKKNLTAKTTLKLSFTLDV